MVPMNLKLASAPRGMSAAGRIAVDLYHGRSSVLMGT